MKLLKSLQVCNPTGKIRARIHWLDSASCYILAVINTKHKNRAVAAASRGVEGMWCE